MSSLTAPKTIIAAFVIAVIVYAVAAINLVGYYHPDEHFQILEFAQYKMGKLDKSGMPWEFHYAMRSSFQPWLVIGLQKITNSNNPHTIALILRMATALFALYSIQKFLQALMHGFNGGLKSAFLILSLFLWFLPYLNVRFSSETWSGLLFLLALSSVVGTQKLSGIRALYCGLFLGLSFLCRYQGAIMIAGLLLWLIIIKKEELTKILLVVAVCTMVVAMGVFLDYYFYGYWTLSVWNYYNMNIVHDKASDYGISDGFSFLIEVIKSMTIPVGSLLILCFLMVVIYRPRSFVVWCVLPFLVIHLIIPHKEVRFLFPVANLAGYIIVLGVQIVWERIKITKAYFHEKKAAKNMFIVGTCILILFNAACLTIAIFSPPFYGRISINNYIYNKYRTENIDLTGLRRNNVFNPYPTIYQSFYVKDNVNFHTIASYDSLETTPPLPLSEKSLFIIQRGDLKNPKVLDLLTSQNAKEIKTVRPTWLTSVMDRFGLVNRDFVLYAK